MTASIDRSIDRLYELLPAVHRLRDGERGYPLRDLLRVIAEQVNLVEENIDQLYDDWFIETASDWAVPYIAELVGYSPVLAAGDPATSRADEVRVLVPRREVANTVAYRRRRGTLSVLEDLARAVGAWPARAVEFYRLLQWAQHLNHLQMGGRRARTVSLRDANALDCIGTSFDPFARTVDVRRIGSAVSPGRYNIPSVGVFLWRLQPFTVTKAPAYCLDAGKNNYTFSVLGNDSPLFTRPQPETARTDIATELNVPTPVRLRAFEANKDAFWGEAKSLAIWTDWAGYPVTAPIPSSAVIPADLSDWRYAPPDNFVAVDTRRGRITFPINQMPRKQVRVSYAYGFSDAIGGGEYERTLSQPASCVVYTVGERGQFRKVADALAAWQSAKPQPRHAVVEITDSAAYVEQISVTLAPDQSLQIRGANRTRPVIRLLDWQTDLPDALTVRMNRGSRFTLDGVMVTGRGLTLYGPDVTADAKRALDICDAHVRIRHSTLVPGWNLGGDCQPASPSKESLEIRNVRARVTIETSILGPIEVQEDEVHAAPIPIEITDSIVDAMDGNREALVGPQGRHAHATLTVRRSTVFGIVQVHAIELAENSLFLDCVHVARRQLGCMRFCYVPSRCRTPRRFHCQPDLVETAAAARNAGEPPADIAVAQALEAARVRPQFTSRRYGTPAYGQLAGSCAVEITEGADDGAEMGVFHDLFQPQRLANVRQRLEEFTPAGMDAGVIIAS